ncbi:DUF2490 domain-containing protein [Nitrosomonas sp. Nm51]|uniref:DUF2490 domain-containing protein n=1 Tax=Nitrosomonas sp. Nm51 TaxID=133720 RepID=UPI001C4305F9|nr:DUF2490 domain-containing protein [Nitrosomonas sp. Nm51]
MLQQEEILGCFGTNASRFAQGIVRPGIGYVLNEKTSVWLGYGWIPAGRPYLAAVVME